MGLVQWATGMVPTLLPFMIISSMMIYTGVDVYLTKILKPFIKPWFACSSNGLYAIFMGFLCGFPMGAKAACDLLKNKKITKEEAEYLLAFCNNISPTYFMGIIFPILLNLGYRNKIPFLFGLYGVPLLYGIFLGKVKYKTLSQSNSPIQSDISEQPTQIPIVTALRLSCLNGIQSILLLGGYVTFVNAFRVLPNLLGFSQYTSTVVGSFLEIVHGIPGLYENTQLSAPWKAFWIMVSLSFNGICCMLQTSSIAIEEDLSMKKYICHKCILTGITAFYYSIVLFAF